MNIFALDDSPGNAARCQHDRHVVKMILESAQMLSAASHASPDQFPTRDLESLYKPTHLNHPCNLWVRESANNYVWLALHMHALLAEYHHRFPGKSHACNRLMYEFMVTCARIADLPHSSKSHRRGGFLTDVEGVVAVNPSMIAFAASHSPFAVAMPDHFKATGLTDKFSANDWAIESYRRYYLAEKVTGNRWTNPTYIPKWLEGFATIHRPSTASTWRKPAMIVGTPIVPSGMGIPSFLKSSINR